ncbi:hypothetical protein OEG86_10200 [Hoeflea alexandrii]|uniref:urease accessory protein UreF n=1 Tax=Hoeflea alexandrii TaxID=288436 RepID=UPI00226D837B|nr:urease accessory UreF family protein [Hoeflea alexandrii]MCY0152543.1 hypothetical protein [Hoeflea alexandrii]
MNDATALLRLMSWLSPVFPIGGFAYSAGLEQAVHAGHVGDRESLAAWVEVQLTQGAQWNDAVMLVEAHRGAGDRDGLAELSDLCRALCVGQERLNETVGQGTSFLQAVSHWVSRDHFPGRETPLPVAVGIAAGVDGIDPRLAVGAYLHAFASNQLQCAIRLSVLGQDGAAGALARPRDDHRRNSRARREFDTGRSWRRCLCCRYCLDEPRDPRTETVPVMIIVSALFIALVLGLTSALHFYWAAGGMWLEPETSRASLEPSSVATASPECPTGG